MNPVTKIAIELVRERLADRTRDAAADDFISAIVKPFGGKLAGLRERWTIAGLSLLERDVVETMNYIAAAGRRDRQRAERLAFELGVMLGTLHLLAQVDPPAETEVGT